MADLHDMMVAWADYFLLGGVALFILSLIFAISALIRSTPPRAAALTFVLALLAVTAAACYSPNPVAIGEIGRAWDRITTPAPSAPAAQ